MGDATAGRVTIMAWMAGMKHINDHPFVKAVGAALRGRCGLSPESLSTRGSRVIVACSGGADSVALLRALAAIAPRRTWGLKLAVGHVQHHLRGDREAEGDAKFVAELAARLDLPFLRADLRPSDATGNTEAWARRERYAALLAMAVSFEAKWLAVAHHADDQLETFLMRALRGASLRGLAAMTPRRRLGDSGVTLIRPMLTLDRAATHGFLLDIGQAWREDRTNSDLSRVRARLRADVLPVLRTIRADAAREVVRLCDRLRDASRFIDTQAARSWKRVVQEDEGLVLDRGLARELPRVVLSSVIRKMVIASGVRADSVPARSIEPVCKAACDRRGGVRRFEFGGGVVLTVRAKEIVAGRG